MYVRLPRVAHGVQGEMDLTLAHDDGVRSGVAEGDFLRQVDIRVWVPVVQERLRSRDVSEDRSIDRNAEVCSPCVCDEHQPTGEGCRQGGALGG